MARLSSVYLLFPRVMRKLIKTQFTLMCSISKLNIFPCLIRTILHCLVLTHLDATDPNTRSPQVSVLWYLIIRWFHSSGWVLVIERLIIRCKSCCVQWRSQPENLVMLCKYFRVHKPWKQSISKEMNNDNDWKFA
jgi:hypothetical protein